MGDEKQNKPSRPAENLAMLEEIQTIAQLIHDYAIQQLMEQCALKEEEA